MTLQRAYSLLTVKGYDDDLREITGIATTPSVDRTGDIVEPEGAQFQLPIPLLWQHDSRQPIGHVLAAKVTKAGIEIRAKLAKTIGSVVVAFCVALNQLSSNVGLSWWADIVGIAIVSLPTVNMYLQDRSLDASTTPRWRGVRRRRPSGTGRHSVAQLSLRMRPVTRGCCWTMRPCGRLSTATTRMWWGWRR